MISYNPVFSGRPVTIFAVMSALANEYNAINLGQGFPDEDGPDVILERAAKEVVSGNNQYAPVMGVPALREAVAHDNQRFYGLEIDWQQEVLVTSGASEALAASFLGLLNQGDEAVLFAPYYDSYAPMVEAAGAKPVIIQLEGPAFRIEREALEAVITERTKVIAINTPHNPLGKVFDAEELQAVADAALAHDLIVICDEVYEHLVFDDQRHVPLMALPGMRERCVRIGSAGKTFSLTGWRIGYATASASLITAISKTKQFMGYTTPAHLQVAIAEGLSLPDDYFREFTSGMQSKRDFFLNGMRKAGFDILPCHGTYFATMDIRNLGYNDDRAFCEMITKEAGVTAVPLSAFYHHQLSTPPTHYVRFCFCKQEVILADAIGRLNSYFCS